jgi:autotransporter-associated beta strand protein
VQGAGTPGAWTGGSAWTWNGGTVEAWGNLNINAPAVLGLGGATVNTVGPDGVTYSGLISSVLSGSGSFTKTGAGTLVMSGSNTYTGTTTVNAGVLRITGSLGANGSNSVLIVADSTGNTQMIRTTGAGASYDGLGSSVTSGVQTHADIMAGANTTNNANGEYVDMRWRLRVPSEPPAALNGGGLIAEVMTLTGMANAGTTGTGQADPYALQMTFSPTYFAANGGASLPSAATAGLVHLDWLNGSSQWVNAVGGDFGAGTNIFTNVQSSWATFAAANGITDSNVGNFLGSWGVDVADDEVWAVVNHNSSFSVGFDAVVPEPTIGAAAIVGMGLLSRRRRKIAENRGR